MNTKKYNQGVSTGAVIGIIAIIAIVAGGYYFLKGNPNSATPASSSSVSSNSNSASNAAGNYSNSAPAGGTTRGEGSLSGNLCDYLTPSLVAQYISTPLQPDSSVPASMSGRICVYQTAGAKAGGNDIIQLGLVTTGASTAAMSAYTNQAASGGEIVNDSSHGFSAWYIPDNTNGTLVYYFASSQTIAAIALNQKNVGLSTNLQAAENIAKAIEPKLP